MTKANLANNKILMPVSVLNKEGVIYIVHFIMDKEHHREPFFIDTLAKKFNVVKSQVKLPEEDESLARPLHYNEDDPYVVMIPLDEFILQNSKISINKEIGFIFHMSRCGSTLAAQMLAHNNKFYVLSEPSIINAILDPAFDISDLDRRRLLVACVCALISTAPNGIEVVFIKFRSWNTFYLNLITEEFPQVKWVYIHRHGLEVLSSVIDKPPGWLRSRNTYVKYFSELLHISIEDMNGLCDDEYISRLLGEFCRIAASSKSVNKLPMDYIRLKEDFIDLVLKNWNIKMTNEEINKMQEVSEVYSKNIDKKIIFTSDTESKRSKATKEQIDLVDKFVEFERIRLK